ncbi:hypothetical protein [Zobellia amurskyensis]|uniref:hypothetical protein n=1 Tax=Zobellia amurskyensis TaxID=248905 RepID=UPI001F37CE9C|nr:hypothetical protein [Zobellia amurskyensis]
MLKKIFLIFILSLAILIGVIYISVSTTDQEFKTCEILNIANLDTVDFHNHDSVLVAANILYKGNTIKKIVQGEQYRDVWETPIKAPIAFLDTLKGGLQIIDEGGGQQTHSLKLKAKNGTVYTLRSVTKNPEPLIPEFARTLGIENIIVDGISAQHPYAALVVAELAQKSGVLSTQPQLLFLPKQSRLDTYNSKFGNRLYLLEQEDSGNAHWTKLPNAWKVVDTEELQLLKMDYGKDLTVEYNFLVRARLFDLLIGDWDRHAKQWGWIIQKNSGKLLASPLPCDRDNAFFKIEGLVPTVISNKAFIPDLQNFEKDIDYLPGLVMDFDTYFLRNIDEKIFIQEAKYLQTNLTDKAIIEAFKVWPREIYDLNGEEIIEKIAERRSELVEYAIKFKEVLNQRQPLTKPLKGSKDNEISPKLIKCFECLP